MAPVSGQRELLREVASGRLRPAFDQEPLLSSHPAGWDGVRLEHHRAPGFELPDSVHLNHVLVLQLVQPIRAEWQVAGRTAPSFVPVNALSLIPAGVPVRSRTAGGGEFVTVSLTPQFFLRAVGPLTGGRPPELRPSCAFNDDLLRALMLQLRDEAGADGEGNPLYAEMLATTLAAHLVRRYSEAPEALRATGGLARPVLARVIEYLEAHLGEALTLDRLAEVANLSAWHFARGFKQATGLAPHAFLLRARLQRAQAMLQVRENSLAEVAKLTGFCDQSHLARHFRRAYGRSPAAWRRERFG